MDYKPRRKLTREFKLEAVRQAALSEKPKAQLARELGVRVGQLRTWRLEFEKEAVTGIAKPDRSAADDLEQLRRENAKLKMEIEILKKAAVGSTDHCNTAWSLSAGARNPKVLRGRRFNRSAILFRSDCEYPERLVPFGKYWRRRRLVFSFVPRCQGLCGSQK